VDGGTLRGLWRGLSGAWIGQGVPWVVVDAMDGEGR